MHWFLIVSTSILFLIGAGLFSKAIGFFEYYQFAKGVGGDVAETGDGPGSYRVQGNVWHLTYGEIYTSVMGVLTVDAVQVIPKSDPQRPTVAGRSSTAFSVGVSSSLAL